MNKTEKLEAIQKNLKLIDSAVFHLHNIAGLNASRKTDSSENVDRMLATTRTIAATLKGHEICNGDGVYNVAIA